MCWQRPFKPVMEMVAFRAQIENGQIPFARSKDMDRRGFDRSCYYADLQAHTCLLDGFVNQVRKFEKAKAQPAQNTPER